MHDDEVCMVCTDKHSSTFRLTDTDKHSSTFPTEFLLHTLDSFDGFSSQNTCHYNSDTLQRVCLSVLFIPTATARSNWPLMSLGSCYMLSSPSGSFGKTAFQLSRL